jgi:hypothetical protein
MASKSRPSKFGAGIIGEAAFKQEQAKRVERKTKRKFGPGMLDNPTAAESAARDAERKKKGIKVVADTSPLPAELEEFHVTPVEDAPEIQPEPILGGERAGDEVDPGAGSSAPDSEPAPEIQPEPILGGERAGDEVDPGAGSSAPDSEPASGEGDKVPASTISVADLDEALKKNPAAFDEFFLPEMNRKPGPRKTALHLLLKVAEEQGNTAAAELITQALTPVTGATP